MFFHRYFSIKPLLPAVLILGAGISLLFASEEGKPPDKDAQTQPNMAQVGPSPAAVDKTRILQILLPFLMISGQEKRP